MYSNIIILFFGIIIIITSIILAIVIYFIFKHQYRSAGDSCSTSIDCPTGLHCSNSRCLIPVGGSCEHDPNYCDSKSSCISGECTSNSQFRVASVSGNILTTNPSKFTSASTLPPKHIMSSKAHMSQNTPLIPKVRDLPSNVNNADVTMRYGDSTANHQISEYDKREFDCQQQQLIKQLERDSEPYDSKAFDRDQEALIRRFEREFNEQKAHPKGDPSQHENQKIIYSKLAYGPSGDRCVIRGDILDAFITDAYIYYIDNENRSVILSYKINFDNRQMACFDDHKEIKVYDGEKQLILDGPIDAKYKDGKFILYCIANQIVYEGEINDNQDTFNVHELLDENNKPILATYLKCNDLHNAVYISDLYDQTHVYGGPDGYRIQYKPLEDEKFTYYRNGAKYTSTYVCKIFSIPGQHFIRFHK